MNVKKIIIIVGIIIVIIATSILSGYLTEKRASKIYSELESRYSNLEESNRQLTEINGQLEANNIRLKDQIGEVNSDIKRATIIVGEFEESISGTRDTIERIEITVEFIEQIVEQLPEEIIVLENSDID